ncbi:MAG: ATP-binding cassette domain-containing protein [Thermomicrobiales bacterium]|nr:ATP-binding cassette domain-containing protein [Thermomicrobiales bacterium]
MSFGPISVLNDVSFVVNTGDRVGLVGANGVGKSTLLRIITGEIAPDSGTVLIPDGITPGYLAQQPPLLPNATVDDLIYEILGALRQLKTRLREIEIRLSDSEGDVDTLLVEYGELQEQFERAGGYEIDHQIEIVIDGLGLGDLDRQRQFASLSGGEQERVLLATLLLRSPDLLLLDEPTNHLDFDALGWLENYLSTYPGAILAVSHDRAFLNTTATRIIEIDERTRTASQYVGNYDEFAEQHERERAEWVAQYAAQQDEIHELRRAMRVTSRQVAPNRAPRDPDKTAYDFKAGRIDIAIARGVRAAEERLRRIESDAIEKPPSTLRILPRFDVATLRSAEVIAATNLRQEWDGKVILDDLSFVVGAGDRIVIVGPNGAGKTTLLNIIAGRAAPTGGEVHVARDVLLGYLDQAADLSAESGCVLDVYRHGLDLDQQTAIDELIRYGLFTIEDIWKSVSVLSAGERRKLQLARLLAEHPTVLLLDEPTNHLSFDVLSRLEHALLEYPGPLICVSHDRWFIERFTGIVWEITNGRIVVHHGAPSDALERLSNPAASGIPDVS